MSTANTMELGAIFFKGVGGTTPKDFETAGSIRVLQDGSVSGTIIPARMAFDVSRAQFIKNATGADIYALEVYNQCDTNNRGGIKIVGGGDNPNPTPVGGAGPEFTPLEFWDTNELLGGVYAGISGMSYVVGIFQGSDENLKRDIRDVDEKAVDIVADVAVRKFGWKGHGGESVGWVAQEVEEVLPRAVRDIARNKVVSNDDGTTTVKMVSNKVVLPGEFIPVLWKAVQEQQVTIEAQQKEIDSLKADVVELKAWMVKQQKGDVK